MKFGWASYCFFVCAYFVTAVSQWLSAFSYSFCASWSSCLARARFCFGVIGFPFLLVCVLVLLLFVVPWLLLVFEECGNHVCEESCDAQRANECGYCVD